MKKALLALVCLLLVLGPAAADEDAKAATKEQAADAVLEAVKTKDAKALKALAEVTDPGPWTVADELCRRGAFDAAEVFAKTTEGAATKRLARYVAAQRDAKEEEGARDALANAVEAIEAQRYGDAYEPLKDVKAEDATVLTVKIHFARGMALYVLGRKGESLDSLAGARERASKIGWVTLESHVLQWMAQAELERGHFTQAISHARARVAVEDGLSGRARWHGHAVEQLVKLLRKVGDYDGGLKAALRGSKLMQEAGRAIDAARLRMLAGTVAAAARDFEIGIGYARDGLDAMEHAKDATGIADALVTVGAIYRDMDEFSQAVVFLERAVRHAESTNQPGFRASALSNLGSAYAELGTYPKALTCLEEALAYHRSIGDVMSIGETSNNLAVLYEALGRNDRARKLLMDTLAIYEKRNDEEHIGTVCMNLGVLARSAKRWDEAEQYLNRSASLRRKFRDENAIAGVADALGSLAADRGRYSEAIGHYREAIRICRKIHDRQNLALALANMGMSLHRREQDEEALEALDEALNEAVALRSHQVEIFVRSHLGAIQLELDKPERAIMAVEPALRTIEQILAGLGEEEGVSARAQFHTLFQVGALAGLRLNKPGKILRFLEAGRAGSLLESLGGRDALRFADLPDGLAEAEGVARRAEAKAAAQFRAALRNGTLLQQRTAGKALTAATNRLRDVVGRIQRAEKASAVGLVYPRPASPSEIQRNLAPDQAFVTYAFCMDRILAVVVRQKKLIPLDLGPKKAVFDAWQSFFDGETQKADLSAIAKLRSLLVEPLGLDASVKTVLVSPAGPLCYVPFGALLDIPVAMTPSGTTHALLRTERRRRGSGVLAMGDPAYSNVRTKASGVYVRGGDARAGTLTRLPATREEAERVGDVVLLGEKATEDEFRAGVAKRERWRAVHFACHGRLDREEPMRCALALTPSKDEDGFLTALEVLRMQIPADLAVLSACATIGGRVVHGEGIIGLTRSFMSAGSPRVLCSLWKVDDEATQALMIKFYELWNARDEKKQLPAAQALREAQAFVRSHKKWEAPYYWAAWVLWGLPE